MHNSQSYNSGYYEAIIQIRPKNKLVNKFVLNEIQDKKGVFLSKRIDYKYGTDFYISSKRFIRTIASKLKRRFSGETKISKKLHTKDKLTSKLVYRVTLSFKLKN